MCWIMVILYKKFYLIWNILLQIGPITFYETTAITETGPHCEKSTRGRRNDVPYCFFRPDKKFCLNPMNEFKIAFANLFYRRGNVGLVVIPLLIIESTVSFSCPSSINLGALTYGVQMPVCVAASLMYCTNFG